MSIISAAENTFACRVRNGVVGMGHKQINGGLMPGGRLRMEKLSALVTSGRLNVKPLITHVFDGLDKLPDALQLMKDKPRDLIKPVVRLL